MVQTLPSDIAVAACFVSDIPLWKRYEAAWKSVLNDAGLDNSSFHMADFVARQNPFSEWDEEKRRSVITRLVEIINRNAMMGCATAVVKQDYDELVQGKLRDKLGHYHYTFAVQSCVFSIAQWRAIRTSDPMEYVFDWMPRKKGKHEIIDLFNDIATQNTALCFGVEPYCYAFQHRKQVVQLQAPDILAWEARKYMCDWQLSQSKQKPRGSFKSLLDHVSIQTRFFDKSSLPDFVAEVSARYEAVGWDGPRGGLL
ncbi:MAG TPA: hypothetical protein VLM38_11875 [Blastocatellia bacterium]|nr:hypothetical protein [Blastocatellia bacterium]